ncbi:MAG: penicillin-binding protein 1B [Arenicellales bacterium]
MAARKKKRAAKKRTAKVRRSSSRPSRRGSSRRASPRRASIAPLRPWLLRAGLLFALLLVAYIVYLDFTVRKEMEGKRWALPATVYTQPLSLYSGKPMGPGRLERDLRHVGYQQEDSPAQPGTYSVDQDSVTVYTREFHFSDGEVPARALKLTFRGGRIQSIENVQDGASVAIARIEPRQIGTVSPTRREERKLIKLDDVPPHLVGALLAMEDKNFTEHFGIDPRGMLRALWADIKAGHVVQGGSTITQQLVKNFFLSPERSIVRKINEMIMAVLLEMHYSKREILQTYLNEVYLGQSGNNAIHGFGLASLFYFDRPIDELKVPQTALLVALVRGASYYNPRTHPRRALKRRNLVIDQMQKLGYLDGARADAARAAPLGVVPRGVATATVYPAFVDLMRRQLSDEYADKDLRTDGLRIFTTLDPEVQDIVEEATRKRLKEIEHRTRNKPGSLNAAVVVARVESGDIVAMVGGRHARFSGFNRALDAERPVGSVIKPAVYLAALEASAQFNLATVIEDEPITIRQPGAAPWSPENYSKRYFGDNMLIDALAHSRNVSTARLGMEVGIKRVVDMIHRLGIRKQIPPYPSVVLGAVDLAPIDVMRMYLTIANDGFHTALRTTRSILSNNDQPLTRYPIKVKQVVEPDIVALLHYALQEVIRSGTGHALEKRFDPALGLAGKTGTTDGFRDSWFAGYSGNYVTVVWVGRDDNKSTGLSGATGAMLLWADIMEKLDLTPTYPVQRDRIHFVKVDEQGRYAQGCVNGRSLPFVEGTVPTHMAPCAVTSADLPVTPRP